MGYKSFKLWGKNEAGNSRALTANDNAKNCKNYSSTWKRKLNKWTSHMIHMVTGCTIVSGVILKHVVSKFPQKLLNFKRIILPTYENKPFEV